MSEFLVTVASYWFLSDAMLAQHALEAEGIESVLDDQNMATNYPNAVRGVKLRVRNTDALRAGQVLDAQCESIEEIGEADETFDEPELCPACGSAEIARNPRALIFFTVAALLLGTGVAIGAGQAAFFGILGLAVLLLIWDRERCGECGETWN